MRRRYRPYIPIKSWIKPDKMCCNDQYLVLRIANRIFPYELKLYKLEQFISIRYTVKNPSKVVQGFFMVHHAQSSKRVALAGVVGLRLEKCSYKLWSVWYQRFEMGMY